MRLNSHCNRIRVRINRICVSLETRCGLIDLLVLSHVGLPIGLVVTHQCALVEADSLSHEWPI